VTAESCVSFYGYKHWTLESVPRCFYVGKGLKNRPFSVSRNRKWHSIVKQFGLRVEICIGPITNQEACQWEILNITLENTFTQDFTYHSSHIGCNFTRGGDGALGRNVSLDARNRIGLAQLGKSKSQETRQKLSLSLRGRFLTNSTRQKMSDARKGRRLSDENRKNLWKNRVRTFSDEHRRALSVAAQNRKPSSDETRQKMSKALKGKPHKCGICQKFGHTRPTCPLRRNNA
jgi:hypothetical protein